jgi:hypothetical protein
MIDTVWTESAAWVQAVGTIAAVVGAAWIAARETRISRRREEHARQDALLSEQKAAMAAKTAALNLALLASAQIHDLHVLLRDEARRGRVARVSPSRTLPSTERLLTAFPIQSLANARAMIAFSYFPGALAMAAEIYGNLETEVRAAEGASRSAIFIEYASQMATLDGVVNRRLKELRAALDLDADPAGEAQMQAPPAAPVSEP